LPPEYFEALPTRVRLRALNEIYRVAYRAAHHEAIRIAESDGVLTVSGPSGEPAACVRELRTWLRAKARTRLTPWLRQTSLDVGLPYAKTIIRSQRGRWGSCSARGVISLNCKLLFLPSAEVQYLFVHELCHTRHLNHSKRYWTLVERKLPDFHRFETALRDAWRYVPRWAED
jgi:predicted metal-dependent hydrolase